MGSVVRWMTMPSVPFPWDSRLHRVPPVGAALLAGSCAASHARVEGAFCISFASRLIEGKAKLESSWLKPGSVCLPQCYRT